MIPVRELESRTDSVLLDPTATMACFTSVTSLVLGSMSRSNENVLEIPTFEDTGSPQSLLVCLSIRSGCRVERYAPPVAMIPHESVNISSFEDEW